MDRKVVLEQGQIYSDLGRMEETLCCHFCSLWCYENSCVLSMTAAKSDGQADAALIYF